MSGRRAALWGLATATLLIGGSSAAQQAARRSGVATLQPGDRLRVVVWEQPKYSGEYLVTAEGVLAHPLYQRIRVASVPVTELRDSIVAVLRTFIADPQVTVEPTLRVAVGGEVRQPNLAWLPPETTIAQAVALAGGATERGRLNRTVLFRGGREVRLDLTSPQSAADTIVVHSGDRIVVGRGSNPLAALAVVGSLIAAATSIAVLVRQQ